MHINVQEMLSISSKVFWMKASEGYITALKRLMSHSPEGSAIIKKKSLKNFSDLINVIASCSLL